MHPHRPALDKERNLESKIEPGTYAKTIKPGYKYTFFAKKKKKKSHLALAVKSAPCRHFLSFPQRNGIENWKGRSKKSHGLR